MSRDYKLETIAVQGGHRPDEKTGSVSVPIYQTTAYEFKNADHAADLFDLKVPGHIYTRLSNPTVEVLENRIAMLEGGTAAVAASAGMFAEFMVFAAIAEQGDEILTTNRLYGGTNNLFFSSMKRLGINFIGVDHDYPEKFEAAITDKTKAIYLESVCNPGNDIPDFEAFAKIGEKHGLPIIVDNTYPTPFLFRPFDYGANVVVHSMTKFIGGHGNSMGGIAIEGGNFNWGNGKFPQLSEPDASYHGIKFWETFGNIALAVKMRAGVMRDFGGCLSPTNAWNIIQGVETLHLRMERHIENARKVADFLVNHPKIEWVNFPELEGNKNYDMAKKYFPKGCVSMISFGVKGGLQGGRNFVENIEMAVNLTNLGDTRTLITHPASTTHRQLSAEQKEAAGIADNMVRTSIGIEAAEDIIADFENALKSV